VHNRKYHGVDKEVLWNYKIGKNEEIMRKFVREFMELTWKFYGNTQQGIIMEFSIEISENILKVRIFWCDILQVYIK